MRFNPFGRGAKPVRLSKHRKQTVSQPQRRTSHTPVRNRLRLCEADALLDFTKPMRKRLAPAAQRRRAAKPAATRRA